MPSSRNGEKANPELVQDNPTVVQNHQWQEGLLRHRLRKVKPEGLFEGGGEISRLYGGVGQEPRSGQDTAPGAADSH